LVDTDAQRNGLALSLGSTLPGFSHLFGCLLLGFGDLGSRTLPNRCRLGTRRVPFCSNRIQRFAGGSGLRC
jgi:hypothetical protein